MLLKTCYIVIPFSIFIVFFLEMHTLSESNMNMTNTNKNLVCYFLGYSEEDIVKDAIENGHSLIMERIEEEKSRGCNCSKENPKGR